MTRQNEAYDRRVKVIRFPEKAKSSINIKWTEWSRAKNYLCHYLRLN